MWDWLADRLILAPSTNSIDAGGRQRHILRFNSSQAELWSLTHPATTTPSHEIAVLKFPGAGGRAERVREHPAECWPAADATIYAVNPPGYGTSDGSARVSHIPPLARAAYDYVAARHPQQPILVVGNSLGCLAALYLAARYPLAGLYLRNPAPVHQLIRRRWRYNWWNFGLARHLASRVPAEIDALQNAARCTAPCLLLTSQRDTLVPVPFQDEIASAYAGPLHRFTIAGAAHHDSIPESQARDYRSELEWLWNRCAAIC